MDLKNVTLDSFLTNTAIAYGLLIIAFLLVWIAFIKPPTKKSRKR